ncbi:MAG: hypothetical protein FJZ90_11725 [Chloroflexi bacterium]|nr:hypothetical protein [Chloroflexota bacterium]
MTETIIHPDDLLPADILLYRGKGIISEAIQFFDATPLSHASVYLGEGKVGEAVAKGLVEQDIRTSIKDSVWVKAYRLVSRPDDMEPVLKVARKYLKQGNRYGYEQLLILAVLCTTRKLKTTPVLRRLLRTLLDAASSVLTDMVSKKKQPMICSEFAYRVYDEAVPPPNNPYAITIEGMLPLPAEADLPFAAPMAPQAAASRVHPESLAALFGSPASATWLMGPAESFAAEAAPSSEATNEVEALLETYMAEAQDRPVTIEELRLATDRFAVSLYEAQRPAEGEPEMVSFAAMDAVAKHQAAYRHLFQTAADFVTPGDLLHTESLYCVGQLQG